MSNLRCCFIFIFVISSIQLSGQYNIIKYDSVLLSLEDEYRGQLHWQYAYDSINWINIYKGTTNNFIYTPYASSQIRAKITEAYCEPIYSAPLNIHVKSQNNEPLTNYKLDYFTPSNIPNQDSLYLIMSLKDDYIQVLAFGQETNIGFADNIVTLKIINTLDGYTYTVFFDNEGLPYLLYESGLNTDESLPYMLKLDHIDDTTYILRNYDYNWTSKTGTLNWEALVTEYPSGENEIELIYENLSETMPVLGKTKKISSSTYTNFIDIEPVANHRNIHSHKSPYSLEFEYEKNIKDKIADIFLLLKKTQRKLIAAPCKVSKILKNPDRKHVCRFGDNLNKWIDVNFFNQVEETLGQSLCDPNSTDPACYTPKDSNDDHALSVNFTDYNEIRDHENDVFIEPEYDLDSDFEYLEKKLAELNKNNYFQNNGNHLDEELMEIDLDSDGIPYADDKCAHTPPGSTTGADGCSPDSDGDGVPDVRDVCNSTAENIPVDYSTGCPVLEGFWESGSSVTQIKGTTGTYFEINSESKALQQGYISVGTTRIKNIEEIAVDIWHCDILWTFSTGGIIDSKGWSDETTLQMSTDGTQLSVSSSATSPEGNTFSGSSTWNRIY